jgi:release factor glutamine methyltransferase
MVKTYGELYRQVCRALEQEEGPNAAFTARELLAHVTGKTTAQVLAMDRIYASEENAGAYLELAGRVLAGEPLAYILGKWDFYGMTLTVTPDVLIPRDDTMAVVELALEADLPQSPRILDLCTGSGCIGLALATQRKDARVTLADLSQKALRVAKKNVTDLHLSGRVACMAADALSPAPRVLGQFDLIVSNPPYITGAEMDVLQRSVRDYEPRMALYGGEDGLDFYRAIAVHYQDALRDGGYLCFEFGMGQELDVCRILADNDYEIVQLRKDSRGVIRAVMAKKKEREQE